MCRSCEIVKDDSFPVTVDDVDEDDFQFFTNAIRHSHSPYDLRLQNARVTVLDEGRLQVSILNNSNMLPLIPASDILAQAVARYNKVFSRITVTWCARGMQLHDCNWKRLELVMRPRTRADSESFLTPTIINDYAPVDSNSN